MEELLGLFVVVVGIEETLEPTNDEELAKDNVVFISDVNDDDEKVPDGKLVAT